jgi:hypothetical protein
MNRVIVLLAMLAILSGSSSGNCADVYTNGFEGAVGPEWSSSSKGVTPIGSRSFLGEFGNTRVDLTLGNLPAHSAVTVAFDLFIIRTWDGNCALNDWGPDYFSLGITGDGTLLNTTFSNGPESWALRQSYPDNYLADHSYQTGASEVNSLGYMRGPSLPMDSVYHLQYTFAHESAGLGLYFAGSGLQGLADESWGLDNVAVSVSSVPEPGTLGLLVCGAIAGLICWRRRR